MVAAIGLSSVVALAAIISASSTAMNNSLMAHESMRIQTQKHMESLEMFVADETLSIRNTGTSPVTIKEIRVYSDLDAAIVARTQFPEPGFRAEPLTESEYAPKDLSMESFDSKTVRAITDLGNVFVASSAATNAAIGEPDGGKSMIDGMGIASRIIQKQYHGRLFYGYGVVGTEHSLRPYNQVPTTADFAAQILNTDAKIVIPIPKFRAEYQYVQGSQTLQQRADISSNVLSYSQSRTVGGSGSAVQGPDGITFSGTGSIILKLNSLAGQTLLLEGTVPPGSELKLVEFDRNDLMAIPYNTAFGWSVWSSSYGAIHDNHLHSGCGSPFSVSHTMSLRPQKQVSPQYSVKRSVGTTQYNPAFVTSSSGGQITVESISETVSVGYCNWGQICGDPSCTWGWTEYNFPNTSPPHTPISGTVSIFDQNPPNTEHVTFGPQYQFAYSFPAAKQMYLVAKPNGSLFTIKASLFNPHTPYLSIYGLPANIPYEIIKDGHVGARGISDQEGVLALFLDEVNIGGAAPAATMSLYPSSMTHRGTFSTVVFDNANARTLYIPTNDHKVYVSHAYVQIPITGNVTITGLRLDDALFLPYLDGNYTTGDRLRVPIISGYGSISMKISGIPASIKIEDVLGGSGLRVVEPATSTITQYDDDGMVTSASSTAGAVAYMIATSDEKITSSVTATISGSSEIENRAYFGAPPPPPPPPPPSDPLKAYVDIYRNGQFVSQQQIYFNANPVAENHGAVYGSMSSVLSKYTYPQTAISGTFTTSAAPGDMIEFYLYANIHADGPVPPVPQNHILYNYVGKARATVTIHSGSILSS